MQKATRLFTIFQPKSYILNLIINPDPKTLHGTATIIGESINGEVHLHAKKSLKISNIEVDGKSAEYSVGKDDELSLNYPDPASGEHVVVINYSLVIDDATHGIYNCYYTQNGVRKNMIVTQLESHYAREVFPCVDEPEAKATIELTVTTTEGLTVLANMPPSNHTVDEALQTVSFGVTPRMSTYLFALAIGELHGITGQTKNGVTVGAWATTLQQKEHLEFALEHSIRSIEFFEDYFGVPYPLPKSDQLALPDVTSGVAAMENWGLVTYREESLIVDPKFTSISTKRRAAIVISHELSHQWFGNLVTMAWWNDLWLNESFATVMEYIAVNAIWPEWNVWLEYAAYEEVAALRRDSIDGVQPIQIEVNHPDEIGTIFDASIVYAKGSRMIRMLQKYIGEDAFRAGLKQYFTKHQYSNTIGDDLWIELTAASGKDVVSLMHSWLSQPGYPVINASLSGDTLTLQQEQFFIGDHVDAGRLWPVPLGANTPDLPQLLEERSLTTTYTGGTLLLNADDSAHFITKYSDELFARILADVEAGKMSVLNRLQFAHEQSLLARAGMISSDQLITLLQAFRNETSEQVWSILSLLLGELKKFVETNETAEKNLRAFCIELASPLYGKLGLEAKPGEPEDDAKLRAKIVGCMLYGEDGATIADAINIYKSRPIEDIDPELRPHIMGAAVRHGEQADIIDNLLELYKSTPSSELQGDITLAISSSKKLAELQSVLPLLTDTTIIRTQDTLSWYVDLLRNRYSRTITWQWLRDNWEWVSNAFKDEMTLDAFPRYSAMVLNTRQQLSEYREFFTPLRANIALVRNIDMGLNEMEARIALIERDSAAVVQRLANL